jgi:large subunit ribosomal protein L5
MTLQQTYEEKRKELQKELHIENIHAVPKIVKVVVNSGLGEALKDKKILEEMSYQLSLITGQKPAITRSKKAIATFKLRAGMPIGLKVTLRGKRMWTFLEKTIRIVFPRMRDFRGISKKTMDEKGNLNIGFSDLLVFPEVDFENLGTIRGLQITIVTNSKNKKEGEAVLSKIGIPFEK